MNKGNSPKLIIIALTILIGLCVNGIATASDYWIFDIIRSQDIESLVEKYSYKMSATEYPSQNEFNKAAGITKTDGNDWVFLIDIGSGTVALSDGKHRVVVQADSKGTLEYVNDILSWRIGLLEGVEDYVIQATLHGKKFSILEVRSAFSPAVSDDVAELADLQGRIDLHNSDKRNKLIGIWKSDKSTANTMNELGNFLEGVDTNGDGTLDFDEIFGN